MTIEEQAETLCEEYADKVREIARAYAGEAPAGHDLAEYESDAMLALFKAAQRAVKRKRKNPEAYIMQAVLWELLNSAKKQARHYRKQMQSGQRREDDTDFFEQAPRKVQQIDTRQRRAYFLREVSKELWDKPLTYKRVADIVGYCDAATAKQMIEGYIKQL